MTASRAYANAAFEHGKDHHELDTWYTLLNALSGLKHPALHNPRISPKDMLASLTEGLVVSETQKQWLLLIITHRHTHLLSKIAQHFIAQYQDSNNIAPIDITSARPFSTQEQQQLINKMEKKLAKSLIPTFLVDPQILGGIKFSYKGRLIDLSIAKTLHQLSREI